MIAIIFLFIGGTVIGSFLNVVIDRSARNEKLDGRSYCESCHRALSAKELIPIISYLLQKGRCRNCGAALSLQYPVVELATGIIFGFIAWKFSPLTVLDLWPLLMLSTTLIAISSAIVIFVYDARWQLIPTGPLILLATSALGISALRTLSSSFSPISAFIPTPWHAIFYDLAAALFFSCLLFALWFFSRGRWIGFGDVKLIFATSLATGFPLAIPAFFFSFWLGGIAGIALLILKKKGLKEEIPFGPYLLLGALLSFFIPKALLHFLVII